MYQKTQAQLAPCLQHSKKVHTIENYTRSDYNHKLIMKFQTLIVVGSPQNVKKQISDILKEEGLSITSDSPDTQIIKPDKKHISIDQIRDLKKHIYQKPIRDKKKIIIIEKSNLLTDQAQNALLKLLEEPPPYALIFLTCLDKYSLLPTIISRSIIIVAKQHNKSKESQFNDIDNKNIEKILEELNQLDEYEQWIDFQINTSHQKLLESIKHHNKPILDSTVKIDYLIKAKKMIQANVDPKFILANLAFNLKTKIHP